MKSRAFRCAVYLISNATIRIPIDSMSITRASSNDVVAISAVAVRQYPAYRSFTGTLKGARVPARQAAGGVSRHCPEPGWKPPLVRHC